MPDTVFVPIYEKDGNKFFIIQGSYAGKTESEAHQIGLGSMLVECVFLGMKFTFQVKEMDPTNTPHAPAELGGYRVGIIEGPLFDQAQAETIEAAQ